MTAHAAPTVLHVAPHPDDEALGAPGVLLMLRDAGWRVLDLVVSLGRPADHDRRRAEAAAAARLAGFELLVPDPPVALSSSDDQPAARARVVDVVRDLVDRHRPAVVVSPSPFDGHHGHETVGAAVAAALARGGGPRWWMWGLWADLPHPNLFAPLDSALLARADTVLDAHTGELARNDYARLLRGRAMANAVLGAERVFGFGAPAVPDVAFAELLTEAHFLPGQGWFGGRPRVLTAASALDPAPSEPAPFPARSLDLARV